MKNKIKVSDNELIYDLKAIKRDYTKGKITLKQAKLAINAEIANYLRGL